MKSLDVQQPAAGSLAQLQLQCRRRSFGWDGCKLPTSNSTWAATSSHLDSAVCHEFPKNSIVSGVSEGEKQWKPGHLIHGRGHTDSRLSSDDIEYDIAVETCCKLRMQQGLARPCCIDITSFAYCSWTSNCQRARARRTVSTHQAVVAVLAPGNPPPPKPTMGPPASAPRRSWWWRPHAAARQTRDNK